MATLTEAPHSVFIIHWNRPAECLSTIAAFQGQGVPVAIHVVDNSSNPECLEALRKGLPEGVALVELPANKGWGGGLNVLLKEWLAATGPEYCFVSAHDALLKPGCLRLLVAAMDQDKTLGIACPQYDTPEVAKFSPVRGITFIRMESRNTGEVTTVEIPHGTLQIFRRQCLEQTGLLDERYFAYGDEAEIGLRARKKGWRVGLVWGAIVINPGTWTSSPVVGYLSARSSLLMARVYGGVLKALARAALMFANTIRLAFSPSEWNTMSSPRARLLAIRDFLLGRYGPPPRALTSKSGNTGPTPLGMENKNSSDR